MREHSFAFPLFFILFSFSLSIIFALSQPYSHCHMHLSTRLQMLSKQQLPTKYQCNYSRVYTGGSGSIITTTKCTNINFITAL